MQMYHRRTHISLMPALVLATLACRSAWQAMHSSILQESGNTVRLIVRDCSSKPLAGAEIEVIEVLECIAPPCSLIVRLKQKSDTSGSVRVPRKFIRETTMVGTPTNEARELKTLQGGTSG